MVDIYTDLRALEDEACHKFETRVAVEAAEREREADKEWADMDDFLTRTTPMTTQTRKLLLLDSKKIPRLRHRLVAHEVSLFEPFQVFYTQIVSENTEKLITF